MKSIEIKLTLGKETKGTYRFENVEPDTAVSALYVRKEAFESGKPPQSVRLIVEAVDAIS